MMGRDKISPVSCRVSKDEGAGGGGVRGAARKLRWDYLWHYFTRRLRRTKEENPVNSGV